MLPPPGAALDVGVLLDGVEGRPPIEAVEAVAHQREVVQELGPAVVRAIGGDLRDDATMVCLDWHGGPPRRRDSAHGADGSPASPARPDA